MKPFKMPVKKPIIHKYSSNGISEEFSIYENEEYKIEVEEVKSTEPITIEDLKNGQKPLKAQISNRNVLD